MLAVNPVTLIVVAVPATPGVGSPATCVAAAHVASVIGAVA